MKTKIQENLTTSIVKTLKKNGYYVEKDLKYPGSIYRGTRTKYNKYVLDIFAYRGSNDIVVIEFENCESILSHDNKNKWKYLISKPGIDLHIIVPLGCREKVYLTRKIKNIPVRIHDYSNWRNIFDLKLETLSK
ncbi:MAG: hypothetical protein PQ975_05790 [Methanobacterium sp.]|jgi:hypothetical protein